MSDVAEIVNKVQQGEAPSTEEYAALQAAVESTAVPINVRVRALPALTQHIAANQALLPKVFAAIVKMLEEDVQVVHSAVVKALVDLSTSAAKFDDAAKQSDVVRDSADVLLQISLNGSGFAPDVRKAARDAIYDQLPALNVLAVAVKALHLLSNERWNDEPAQLDAERRASLDLLTHVATKDKFREQWTEEAEAKLMKFLTAVFGVVSSTELGRVLNAVMQLPGVKAKEGQAVVEALLKLKVDQPRGLEAVSRLRLPATAVNDAIADKLAPLLTKGKPSDAFATQVAKTFVNAARHVSAEKAPKHVATVKTLLLKSTASDSWTYIEALLATLGALNAKAPEAVNEVLADEAFRSHVHGLAFEASLLAPKLHFAIQKIALAHEAQPKHAEAEECLKHVICLAALVAVKKAPEATTQCSWEHRQHAPRAPHQKRVNVDAPLQQRRKAQPAVATA